MRSLGKDTFKKISLILELLRRDGNLNVRTIALTLDMNVGTVVYFLNHYLDPFIDSSSIGNMRLRIVKLKENKRNSTIEDVIRFYQVRKSLKHTNNSMGIIPQIS